MKQKFLLFLLILSNNIYSQNYKKLFNAIEDSDFIKTDNIISELKNEKKVDTLIICLAKAMIFSKENSPNYNPKLAYTNYLLFYNKSDLKNSNEVNRLVDHFKFNFTTIKSDLENKLYNATKAKNTIGDFESIIKICSDCNYLLNAENDLDELEFKRINKINNIKSYNYFINKYPKSKNIDFVINKRDSIQYSFIKDNMEKIEEFLLKKPSPNYYIIAKTKLDSIKNNFERKFFQNGKLYERGKYKDDIKIGKWYIYYENGNIKNIDDYSVNGIDAEYFTYFENGNLEGKGFYRIDVNARATTTKSGECVEYFENGQVKFKGNFTNGQVEYFFQNGKINKVENYKNGLLEGDYLIYYDNGEINNKFFYKHGRKDGENLTYGKSIQSKISYENRPYELRKKEVYFNGDIIESIFYFRGEIDAKEYYISNSIVSRWERTRTYDSSGKLAYVFSGYDKRTGEVEIYDSNRLITKGNNKNGKLLKYTSGEGHNLDGLIYETRNYKNGKLNGEYLSYYHGKLSKKGTYTDDIPTGDWVKYYGNGQLKFKGKSAINGVKINNNELNLSDDMLCYGICTYYYENGNLLFKGNFTNGKVEYFTKEGKLFIVENYKNGELNGEKMKFFLDLILTENYETNLIKKIEINYTKDIDLYEVRNIFDRINFKNTEITIIKDNKIIISGFFCENGLISNVKDIKLHTGKYKLYLINGKTIFEGELLNGNLIGESISYDANGEVDEKQSLSDNLRVKYNRDGQIIFKQELKNHTPNGECISYYKDGKVESVSHYKDGKLHGISKSYENDGSLSSINNYKDGLEDCRIVD